jgi:ribose 1,5-bisphosphokinase
MTPPAGDLIGPGHLILVVGPSGAGKDTLLDHVREATRGDDSIMVARRIVTRAASVAEDHDTLTEAAFDQAVAEGAFAIWWGAHGNKYAIPRAAEEAIRAGRTVLCNVSRAVVAPQRARYARVTAVLVTAPEDVLRQRLAARGRSSDGDVAKRVARAGEVEVQPDVVIMNVGGPAEAGARLIEVARRKPATALP